MIKFVIDAGEPWGLMIDVSTYLTVKEMSNPTYDNGRWGPRMFDTRMEAEKWVRKHRHLIPGRNPPYIREWETKT